MARVIRSILLLAGIAVALWLIGHAIFHIGDSAPGSGEGDPVPGLTTP
jgi:hypothetical protein